MRADEIAPDFPLEAKFAWRGSLTRLAFTLRRNGLTILGLDELFDALRLVGMQLPPLHPFYSAADNPDLLLDALRLFWCKTSQDADLLARHWPDAVRQAEKGAGPFVSTQPQQEIPEQRSTPPPTPKGTTTSSDSSERSERPEAAGARAVYNEARLGVLATRPPLPPTAVELDPASEAAIGVYGPVSRRMLRYAWRSVRQPVPDGPRDVPDFDQTISQTIRAGMFAGIAYRRRDRDAARIILLIDQLGSMTPFHRYCRDIAETVRESRPSGCAEAFYFQNVPGEFVYTSPHLTDHVAVTDVLLSCTHETAVLLISDAGAARGQFINNERVRETERFLQQLQIHTDRVAWVNPIPRERWTDSSAEFIEPLLPMFPMDSQGVADAVNVLRGQPGQTEYRLAA